MGTLVAAARGLAVLLAAILVLGSAVASAAPPVPAIQGLSGLRVWPVSLKGSGPYDALVGAFTADITVAGAFRFRADLFAPGGAFIASNATDLTAPAGDVGVEVAVPGPRIASAGADGPYNFVVSAIPVAETGNQTFTPTAVTNVTTFAYRASYFAGYWASLAAPVTDRPLDTDADGLADVLAVDVPINVSAPGEVLLEGCLQCSGFFNPDSLLNESRVLPAGRTTWELRFDGAEVHALLLPYSQALTVWIRLTLGSLGTVADENYTTQSYSSAAFVGPAAEFVSPQPSFAPVDTNRDGFADYLDINVTVRVRETGDYMLHMNLMGWTGVAYVDRLLHLDPGVRNVSVPVSGILVGRLNLTTGDVQMSPIGSPWWSPDYWDYAIETWTAPLSFGMPLASRPSATLLVWTPGQSPGCANVYALDPSTGFYENVLSGYQGNGTGLAVLDLYDGTFDIVAAGCGALPASAAQQVTVSGFTNVSLTLPAGRPWRWNLSLNVAAGNETDVTLTADFGAWGPWYRFLADLEGNLDGTANGTEIARFVREQEAYGWPFFNGVWFNPDRLLVDGRALPLRSVAMSNVVGNGSIVSAASLSTTAAMVYRSQLPSVAGGTRSVVVDLPYSTDALRVGLSVRVQGTAASPATVRSRLILPPGALAFNWSANATVTSPGPGAWDVDIGGLPYPDAYGLRFEFLLGAEPATVWPGPPAVPPPIDPALLVALVLIAPAGFVAAVVYLFRRRPPPRAPAS